LSFVQSVAPAVKLRVIDARPVASPSTPLLLVAAGNHSTAREWRAGFEWPDKRPHVAALPELSVLILEVAREHGRVTFAEAARVSGASRKAVKDHLKALVEQVHLTLHGAGRGAWYGLA